MFLKQNSQGNNSEMEITSAFNTSPDFIHHFEFAKQEEEMMSAVYFSLTCSYSSYQDMVKSKNSVFGRFWAAIKD